MVFTIAVAQMVLWGYHLRISESNAGPRIATTVQGTATTALRKSQMASNISYGVMLISKASSSPISTLSRLPKAQNLN